MAAEGGAAALRDTRAVDLLASVQCQALVQCVGRLSGYTAELPLRGLLADWFAGLSHPICIVPAMTRPTTSASQPDASCSPCTRGFHLTTLGTLHPMS